MLMKYAGNETHPKIPNVRFNSITNWTWIDFWIVITFKKSLVFPPSVCFSCFSFLGTPWQSAMVPGWNNTNVLSQDSGGQTSCTSCWQDFPSESCEKESALSCLVLIFLQFAGDFAMSLPSAHRLSVCVSIHLACTLRVCSRFLR